MKKLFKILFLVFSISIFPSSVLSQQWTISWQNCLGGTETDEANDILKTQDGYLILGKTESNDGDVSYNHGAHDVWLVKVDTTGSILWERSYGGSSGETGYRIFNASKTTYYIVAGSSSDDGDISFDPYPNSTDYWILKIDSIGNIIWDRIVGGNGLDQVWSGTGTSDGGVVAVGWTNSGDGDVSNYYGFYDLWLIKLNSEGETVWDQTIGTAGSEQGIAVYQTSDGEYLVGGTAVPLGEGNVTCVPFNSYAEAIIIKLDEYGNIEWQQCYGGSDHEGTVGFLECENGYLVSASGRSDDGDLTNSGWHGNSDIWLIKIDFAGNIIWQRCFGGTLNEVAKILYHTNNGGYIIIGDSESHDGDVSGNHSESEYSHDIWLLNINDTGKVIWQQCVGGIGNETIDYGAVMKTNSDYIIAGRMFYSPSYDVNCNNHPISYDIWLFEIKDCSLYLPTSPIINPSQDTLCNTTNPTIEFSVEPVPDAWDYEWLLEPEQSGVLVEDSLNAIVTWNVQFEGQAELKVRSYNECGFSDWSEPQMIFLYSCLGTDDNDPDKRFIHVYPNPARNYVVFETHVVVEGDIYIYNNLGNLIELLPITSKKTIWEVQKIQPGIYLYTLRNSDFIISGKFTIIH